MTTVPNIALLQVTNGTLSVSSSFTVTPPGNTTAGSGCYLYIWNGVSATTPEITSITGGGTWVRVDSSTNGVTSSELWYTENVTSVASFSVTCAIAITGGYCFSEFSGILASGSLDTSTKANSSGTSWSFSTGNTATVQDNVCLVLECDAQQNGGKGGANNLPSGFTLATTAGATATHGYMNYKIVVGTKAAQSATVSGSSASSSAVTSILAVFRPVSNVIQQMHTTSNQASTTLTVSVPLAGNTGILAIDNTSGGAGTVTQTNNTWTKVAGPIGGTNAAVDLWYSKNMSGSAGTTITFGNSCASAYTEVYGLSTTAPLDKSVTANGSCGASTTTNAVTGTTATISNNPQIAFAAIGMTINAKGGAWSLPLNGYKSLVNTTPGGNSINLLMNILTSNTTTSTGATLSPTLNTNSYGTVLATFQQTGGVANDNTSELMLTGCGV